MSAIKIAADASARRCLRLSGLVLPLGLAGMIVGLSTQIGHAYPAAVQKACKYDYKRLCRRYEPGTSKMRSCMRASVSDIAPRCYDSLVKHGYADRRRSASVNR